MLRRMCLSLASLLLVILSPAALSAAEGFAYVANSGSNNVSAFAVDAGGALTPLAGSPVAAGSNPMALAADPSGQFLFVANSGSGNVSAFLIDAASGALTPVVGSPFAAGDGPMAAAVDPSGQYLYVVNGTSNDVSAYVIDGASGALTPVAGSPFAAGLAPSGVAVDPLGRYVYVADSGFGFFPSISGYTLDGATGVLTPLAGSPFMVVGSPRAVAVNPAGTFLLVADAIVGVQVLSIDAASGGLTAVAGSPFAAGTMSWAVTVDATGQRVFVANRSSNNVSAFSLDAASGALAPVAGSPFAAVAGPSWVAVDASGSFAYVANIDAFATPFNVNGYSVDAGGALAPVAGSPFSAGFLPAAVALVGATEPEPEPEPEVLQVQIDVLPGSEKNPVNPSSRGMLPVAIQTTADFDALQVSPASVVLGPGGASMTHRSAHVVDVDGDGDLDLLLHFSIPQTGIVCGDTTVSLSGETFGGQELEGSDSLATVGCR